MYYCVFKLYIIWFRVCVCRLHELGLRVGYKALDLVLYRERHNRREIKLLSILTFIATCVWKSLFGHSVELLKAQDSELECTDTSR